jgi:hypothetical protein
VSPGSAMTVRRPFLNFMVPLSTWKLSCCTGWTWPPGTRPSGSTTRSKASSAPSVSPEVLWKMNRSLLIGLSSTCPLNAIGASSAIRGPGTGPLMRRPYAFMLLVRRATVVGRREALALRRCA